MKKRDRLRKLDLELLQAKADCWDTLPWRSCDNGLGEARHRAALARLAALLGAPITEIAEPVGPVVMRPIVDMPHPSDCPCPTCLPGACEIYV